MWDGILNHKVEEEYAKKRQGLYECHTRKVSKEELEKILKERGRDMGKRGPKPGFKKNKMVNEIELIDQQTIKGEDKKPDEFVEDVVTVMNLGDIHALIKKPADWGEAKIEKHDDKVMASVMAFEAKERSSEIEGKEDKDNELMKNIIDDHIPTSYKKPPLGIMPKRFHDEKRLRALIAAIDRYVDAKCQVPLEWIVEYNQLVKEVK